MFHIHLDAVEASQALVLSLLKLGFEEDPFSFEKNFVGATTITPNIHLTYKTFNKKEFYDIWRLSLELCEQHEYELKGYLEGEYVKSIPIENPLIADTMKPTLRVPFHLRLRALNEFEQFKSGEIHLVLMDDNLDQHLVENLIRSGMYPAHMTSENRPRTLFTAQGSKKTINSLISALMDFLTKSGGYSTGKLSVERVIRYTLFNYEKEALPKIIDDIVID